MTDTTQSLIPTDADTGPGHDPINLVLHAEVTLIDKTGTRVHTDSLTDALSVIVDRHRSSHSAGLTPSAHHIDGDGLFNDTYIVTQTDDAVAVEPVEYDHRIDYLVEYTGWQLTDENDKTRAVTLSSTDTIVQSIANRSGRTAVLNSALPGVPPTTTYHPEPPEPVDTSPASTTERPRDAVDESDVSSVTTVAPATRREARQSFLTQVKREEPATRGWRGLVNRAGFRLTPAVREQQERQDISLVSQHWPGPRVISVVNGKGGAGKTPTVILLSAVFARFGGGSVLSWDNNQTRGTLGWRTEQGPHDSTILELLPEAERLQSPGAQAADLAHFVHHQTTDRYDVLRSKPSKLADEQRFEAEHVDRIHAVASKFYRLIIIDSGNDESDPLWRRMIDHTDQLVVATTSSDEKSEAGALLLDDLSATGAHGRHLADNAVVVVSQAEQDAHSRPIATGFKPLAREVVEIPFDPAMVDGHLSYTALRPDTQRAWLSASAAVARGLGPKRVQDPQ